MLNLCIHVNYITLHYIYNIYYVCKLYMLRSICTYISLQEKNGMEKKMDALNATLRRLCTPKRASGKLEVSAEIHRQWKQGGTQRQALLDILVKAGGNKDTI